MEQGLLYCFMVLGVYITFRVLDFPDLTVDGSLPLGAAVTAAMATGGHSVYLATAAGMGEGQSWPAWRVSSSARSSSGCGVSAGSSSVLWEALSHTAS